MGDCLTVPSDSHPPECVIPGGVLTQVRPPEDEHLLLETCRGVEINTLRKSASSWSLTRSTPMSKKNTFISVASWIGRHALKQKRDNKEQYSKSLEYLTCQDWAG